MRQFVLGVLAGLLLAAWLGSVEITVWWGGQDGC